MSASSRLMLGYLAVKVRRLCFYQAKSINRDNRNLRNTHFHTACWPSTRIR